MPVKHNEIHANVRWCILLSLKLAISVNNFCALCGELLFFSLYLKNSAYLSTYLLSDKKGKK